MVARRRKKSVRKSLVGRAYGSRSRRKTLNVKVNPTIASEIWAIIYMSVGVLTILSLQGTFGIVGDIWVNFLRPILGWGIYIIPAIFLMVSVLMFFSKKLHFGASKVLGFVFFMISVLSIFHLSVPLENILEYASQGTYGGYIGFVTNFLFLEVLGIGAVGATIIFVALFLVSLLLIFEIPLRDLFTFIVPEIKLEMLKESEADLKPLKGGARKHRDLEFEGEGSVPEITIHKAKLGGSSKESDSVIYEEDSGEYEGDFDEKADLKINSEDESRITESLSQGAKKVSHSYETDWEFPSLALLDSGDSNVHVDEDVLMDKADRIKKKLAQFGINVAMHEVNVGPTVIQFTLKPFEGIKLSKITSLKNDLALVLAAERIRIEAPIPGKSLVGIEVPNDYRAVVHLREMLESAIFTDAKSKLTLPLGRDVAGKPIIANLENMPHLLIAGATGSGKSICMNAFLISMLYQNSPKDLNFIMVDPKRVELSSYNNIPHLLTPVIQDPEKAAISLRWVVAEMIRRYSDLSDKRVRNIVEYNELGGNIEKMSRIVVVIDELADLMMAAGKEVEASICRIAQMARAVGIHLIIATQRPSVDVITGLIKANIPTRIAFAVSSSIDSRTILDGIGAEDLLGRGDMLYLPTGQNKPTRIQGVYVSTKEIEKITNRVKLTIEPDYDDAIVSSETAVKKLTGIPDSKAGNKSDSKYEEAYQVVKDTRKASASLLQRRLKVGYARAARLIDLLEENGVVGEADGAKPRKILVD